MMTFLSQMNTIQRISALCLCLLTCTVQAQTIEQFLEQPLPATAYLNCAYQQKTATEKCRVTLDIVTASTARTNAFFGVGNSHDLLKIHWPDGNVSEYVPVDSFELWNLADRITYHYRTTANGDEVNLSDGLIIEHQKTAKEHIRLW